MRTAASPRNTRVIRVAEATLARCAQRKALPLQTAEMFMRRMASIGIPVSVALLAALEERVIRTHERVLPEARAAAANAIVRATFDQIRLLVEAGA